MDTTTALAFVVPATHQPRIEEIRAKYDHAYKRWMPHINFVFPFVASDQFESIVDECKLDVAIFDVVFDSIGSFSQGKKGYTLHLKPDVKSEQKLKHIYDALQSNVKIAQVCRETKKSKGFHPHLTVAQCKKSEHQTLVTELTTWLGKGITTTISELSLLQRSPSTGDRMSVQARIPLKDNVFINQKKEEGEKYSLE